MPSSCSRAVWRTSRAHAEFGVVASRTYRRVAGVSAVIGRDRPHAGTGWSAVEDQVRRPGVVVASDINLEVRVIDPAACSVRITQRDREPLTVSGSWDKSEPAVDMSEFTATHKEVYLGRVIPGDIKKVPEILGTRNGVVVEKIDDARWRLSGSPGDEVWCQFWPKQPKTCWDHVEYSRLSVVRDLPDWTERAARVDRALVHLFADLCKGAAKRVPF